ncbi:hypothetical protein [Stenotrophomonas sp. Iso1]|uniref:hypothetical protein n=1 Tax=Stenotrophomonas sp. Iso1 TaxID=2977283 RepID=UPI0022B79370|nr:hypothetical protein [Stenotrophomonas sp. Iso1]
MLRSFLLLTLLLITSACSVPAATSPPAVETTPTPPAATPVVVDQRCRTDADCTVKNVGNCCGYYPACVNVASRTDPAGVQASCQAKGMMSVCGFAEISGCSCVEGQCAAKREGTDSRRLPVQTLPSDKR